MKAIFWFRRDLRLEDNHGLYRALRDNDEVLPLFIFDKNILSKLEDKDDARVTFIYKEIGELKKKLEAMGSSLMVKFGEPQGIFREILSGCQVCRVYANHDYEPYALERDHRAEEFLMSNHIEFLTFKDQVIFEKDDILKENGEPYTVFTPYMKRWKSFFNPSSLPDYDTTIFLPNFIKTEPFTLPSLEEMGFTRSGIQAPPKEIDRQLIQNYDRTRDFPSVNGTSRLGVHLRFGTISIRRLAETASFLNDTYLNELIWREFYMMILWHFPHVTEHAFKSRYDQIRWRNDEKEFLAWCQGKTGYPIVDAGMRQMNETGYMHNRLRMITASFLAKLLLVDWRWGEAYFARKLLDFDLAANNGGWQWSAGTGSDAAPYFRIFNPQSQAVKFDPDMIYTKKWVPELDSEQYPEMLVDYKSARQRALLTYKEALQGR